jgi:diguanylate cyclase (GGDEF)-like protein
MSDLVELHLRGSDKAAAQDSNWKPLVLHLLRILSDVTPDAESKGTVELRAKLNEHRRNFGQTMHPQEERQEAAACVKTCEQFLRHVQHDHVSRESELTELIAVLREATTRLLGDSSDFHAEVLSSADRFKLMTNLDDLRELKREISTEVTTLQRAVEEKKQRDQQAIAKLSQRVELLQADLVKAEEKASIDPLTRIPNRGNLDRTLLRMMEAAKSSGTALALAMIDIDHFKKINDTFGHQIGDRVLLCAAEWLRTSVRHTDFVARYGGEEFAVILADVDLHQAEDRFVQVLKQIASRSYEFDLEGETKSVRFTVSCGVSQLVPSDSDKDLIGRADQALYEAKQKGRNRVVTRKFSRLAKLLSRS